MSIRCDDGRVPVDLDFIATVRSDRCGAEIHIPIGIASAAATYYDTVPACVSEILNAEESHKSNIQVIFAYCMCMFVWCIY